MTISKDNPKSQYYRNSLGKHLGAIAVLECTEFEAGVLDETGFMPMLLKQPRIVKVNSTVIRGDWIIDHLWISVPKEQAQFMERYSPLARKLEVTGRIQEYTYAGSGLLQVGVKAFEVRIKKYRKDLAKKYGLKPYQLLSRRRMDTILDRENQKNIAEYLRRNHQ